ncbi:MAG: hypothetical protein ACRC5S_03250 [Cetobacterium sp.]
MTHSRTPNHLIIEGLVEHSQCYNNNSFVVEKSDRDTVPFLLEILGKNSVKLNFDYELSDERVLIFIQLVDNNDSIVFKEIIVSDLHSIDSEENNNSDFNIEIFDGTIEIISNENIKFTDIKGYIKGYELEQYGDYPLIKDRIIFDVDSEGFINNSFEYNFSKDNIYDIEIIYKNKKFTEIYIHDKPTFYYSSIYHVIQMSNELGILIDNGKESRIDLNILIWRYSKLAFGLAGISGNTIKHDSSKAIITEYVTLKTIIHFITKSIRDLNLTPGLAENSLGKLKVRLGDFQNGEYLETLTTQLIKTHKELSRKVDELEKNLPEHFRYLQATKTSTAKNYKGLKIDRIQNFWGDE